MSDEIDNLEEIAEAARFRVSAAPDDNRKRAKRYRKKLWRDREYVAFSAAKPTLPKFSWDKE